MFTKLFGKKAVEVKQEEVKSMEVVAAVVSDVTTTEEEKKMMEENKAVANEVSDIMMKRMEEAGVNIQDTVAISAYLMAHNEELAQVAEEVKAARSNVFTQNTELNSEMHAEFLEALKKVDLYGDHHIHAVLMSFLGRGDDQKQFVLDVLNVFKRDRQAYGVYFRNACGVKNIESSIIKTTGYVAADSFRTTGDLIEAGVTKSVQAVNKYVFQLIAKGVDKTVGGRPEEMKDYNFVNDAAGRVWDKTKSLVKEKPEQTEAAK